MKRIIFLTPILLVISLVGCSEVSENFEKGRESCPSLNNIPLEEWNPIMAGAKWDPSTKNYNINLDVIMDESGKMISPSKSRWKKFLETQDLNGFEITKDSGLNVANPNCWAYESKKGYNPNYNYCFVQLKKNILDSDGNVQEVIMKELVVVFDHSVLFPVNTTAVFGNDFELWTFTNLSFVKSYCE